MPRSRSRSIVSRYWARMSRASTAPVISRIRSDSVDLPWSMWAMIEKFRMRDRSMARPTLPASVGSGPCVPIASVRCPSKRIVRGEHQEPEEAHHHQRQARRAQQGRQERAEDAHQERRVDDRYRRQRRGRAPRGQAHRHGRRQGHDPRQRRGPQEEPPDAQGQQGPAGSTSPSGLAYRRGARAWRPAPPSPGRRARSRSPRRSMSAWARSWMARWIPPPPSRW